MENSLATSLPFDPNLEHLDRFVFGWLDYALFGLLLLVSVLIGVYFGFFSKQDSTTEYLLGGKRMGCFPVAMSIIARSVIPRSLLIPRNERIEREGLSLPEIRQRDFESPARLTSPPVLFFQSASVSPTLIRPFVPYSIILIIINNTNNKNNYHLCFSLGF